MSANWQAPGDDADDGRDLTSCGACGSDFIHAARWRRDGAQWWFVLRCGECADVRELVLARDGAEQLETHIQRGMDEIAVAAHRIDRERMAAQAEIFIAALGRNLIDAADFRRAA